MDSKRLQELRTQTEKLSEFSVFGSMMQGELSALVVLALEAERLRAALENVEKAGHNDDCLFCARKDFNAREALE